VPESVRVYGLGGLRYKPFRDRGLACQYVLYITLWHYMSGVMVEVMFSAPDCLQSVFWCYCLLSRVNTAKINTLEAIL